MTTWHERAVRIGDVVDAAKSLLWSAAVALGLLFVPTSVGWGAALVAGAVVEGMNPASALLIQICAFVAAAVAMVLVILGIDRFAAIEDEEVDQ